MSMDPTFALTLRSSLALLFGAASLHKLRHAVQFRHTLARYLQGFAADGHGFEKSLFVIIVGLELAVVFACALPTAHRVAAFVSGGMLFLYATAMAVNLLRGNSLLDCGCTWTSTRQSVRPALVIRNALLALFALVLALPMSNRECTAADIVSIVFATLTATLLYDAGNRLLTWEPAGRRQTS